MELKHGMTGMKFTVYSEKLLRNHLMEEAIECLVFLSPEGKEIRAL